MSKSNLPFKVSKQILATLKKLNFSSIPYEVTFGLELYSQKVITGFPRKSFAFIYNWRVRGNVLDALDFPLVPRHDQSISRGPAHFPSPSS